MVRKERLELSRLAALEPKSSASTNSATLATDDDISNSKLVTSSSRRALYRKFVEYETNLTKNITIFIIYIDKQAY
jgi:hypothetical protein